MQETVWQSILSWLGTEGLQIILIVIGSILLARLIGYVSRSVTNHIVEGEEQSDSLVQSEQSKHYYAVAQVVTYVAVALIVVISSVGVAARLGISLTTLVAPATVLGAALGFGAQRVVQDFLAGFFVVTERHYGYGDTVEIWVMSCSEPARGTVEDVTLRMTRLRSTNGEVITIPNGQITKSINRSKDWARAVVDVPVPNQYFAAASATLHSLCDRMIEDPSIKDLLLDKPTVVGVEDFSSVETTMRIVARTLPGKQFEVSRELRARVAQRFSQLGLDPERVHSMTGENEIVTPDSDEEGGRP